ncbi:DNA-directed RNA polymerase II subunit 4 isoform X1 [Arachis ipaensis]|uniref:DNA-directed RNA polymerase II subunit 4 isoform X1 n=1 Tax=Arachis ipaensis TaxID=130454 RepID=UPI000A2B501D|nr:DNA-directed RNA polymerase II subunit 4 isoform X1 [Arachis ipaensis]
MSGEEEENAAELKIGDDFLKAKCLMNCEVSLILEHKYEQLQQTSDDPMNQVSQVFEKSLQYVKRFSRYKNPDAVRQVREILARYQLAEFELCVLGNLCPETVEEAIAMVPSIKVVVICSIYNHIINISSSIKVPKLLWVIGNILPFLFLLS